MHPNVYNMLSAQSKKVRRNALKFCTLKTLSYQYRVRQDAMLVVLLSRKTNSVIHDAAKDSCYTYPDSRGLTGLEVYSIIGNILQVLMHCCLYFQGRKRFLRA